jgi:hypothetical protein
MKEGEISGNPTFAVDAQPICLGRKPAGRARAETRLTTGLHDHGLARDFI